MAINVADNFSYKGSKPLDARTQYATVAAMKAAAEADLSDGIRCYVKEDKKNYIFDSTNTVDSTTGKWRELESGGGGVTNYNDLENRPQIEGITLTGNKTAADLGLAKSNQIPTVPTKVSQLQNDSGFITNSALPGVYSGDTAGLVPAAGSDNEGKYLDNDGNWTVVPMPMIGTINRSDIYDTTEKMTGKWTDGRPVYQRTFTGTLTATSAKGTETRTIIDIGASVDSVAEMNVFVKNDGSDTWQPIFTHRPSDNSFIRAYVWTNIKTTASERNKIVIDNAWFTTAVTYVVTLKYTKTTDAANSYNYADENDYSTSEKIIGKWIGGETLYQKTIAETMPTVTTTGTKQGKEVTWLTTSELGNVIDIQAIMWGTGTSKNARPLPNVYDSTTLSADAGCYINSSGKLTIFSNNTDHNSKSVYVTLKYTKS